MRNVTIALVQFNSRIGDIEYNVKRGCEFVRQAAEKGADLVVFPELFAGGYNTEYVTAHKEELALQASSDVVSDMAKTAGENGIYVVMPCVIEKDGRYYNGEYLFNREGEIEGTYSKVHLWDEEAKLFEKGGEYPVFDLDFGKLGLLICYDAGFPESVRMMALKGAELVLVSSAFCHLHWKRWNTYFGARALENTMYVGAVNATGGAGEEIWFGSNRFYDITGDSLMEGNLNIEEMQLVSVDLDQVKKARAAGCYLTDLRPETYTY
ncbi:MAG: carbon-nitrogen hydrolase family protein [Lachnospiraceae bacterium]|nr:carbon-nitrogen hydrolase family protein [Lachnospiraceae bacterium]